MGSGDDNLKTQTRERLRSFMKVMASARRLQAEGRAASELGQKQAVGMGEARAIIEDWPEAPKTVGQKFLEHYGPPNEATPTKLLWYRTGPWARMELSADEVVQNFPTPPPTSLPSTSTIPSLWNGPRIWLRRGPGWPAGLALRAAALSVVMALAACGGGVRRASDTTPHLSTTATVEGNTAPADGALGTKPSPADNHPPEPAPAPPPAFKADTRPDVGQHAGPGRTSVAEVDVARHDEGFDRVVFHIAGDGKAGWHVRYVKAAQSQGSGQAVEVAGSTVLEVTLTNMGYPDDVAGPSYDGPKRIRPSDTLAIREIVNDHVYEGQHVFFVGTVRELPFRVYRLEGPQRVVVDIQHPR